MNSSGVETELKLTLPPSAADSLFSLPALKRSASAPKSERIVTTYYETPGKDLARNGLSVRIRKAPGGRTQTVKSIGRGSVAESRGEWEWPVRSENPDLRLLTQTPIADRLVGVAGRPLEPAVVTDVVRTTQTIETENGVVEAALDLGAIDAGGARQSICELELELREGSPASLYRLALELHSAVPFAIEVESKASRGFRLIEGAPPRSRKASPRPLDREGAANEVFRDIAGEALGHLVANRGAALVGDPEGVHQTRVAIRRIRSALKLFAPHLEAHTNRLFADELRRLGRTIGDARDRDVFCDEILPRAVRTSGAPGLGEIARRLAEKGRAAAHETCAAQLRDSSFTTLVLALAAWVETGCESNRLLGSSVLKHGMAEVAPDLLDRLDKKATRRGAAVRSTASATELHPLRKSLKKLRYGVEFVGSLYRPKKVNRFLRRLKDLQKALGEINDAAMATRLAENLAAHNHFELGPFVAAVAGSRAGATRDAMAALTKSWRAYRDEPRFWR